MVVVIASNSSYRDIAIIWGRRSPADVTVVRTGPDPAGSSAGPSSPNCAAPKGPNLAGSGPSVLLAVVMA